MSRPYSNHSIDELEKLLEEHPTNHQVLGELRSELTYRTTARAKLLLRQVEALIQGKIPPPAKGMKSPGPDDQGGLFDPPGRKRMK